MIKSITSALSVCFFTALLVYITQKEKIALGITGKVASVLKNVLLAHRDEQSD
jgi:uncharacterized membrane protein